MRPTYIVTRERVEELRSYVAGYQRGDSKIGDAAGELLLMVDALFPTNEQRERLRRIDATAQALFVADHGRPFGSRSTTWMYERADELEALRERWLTAKGTAS